MAESGLLKFINTLETKKELSRIKAFVDPVLEITEVTDRITKNDGKALLFENNGTAFPVLINTFGSDKRIAMALGWPDIDDIGNEMERILHAFSAAKGPFLSKLSALPSLLKLSGIMPSRTGRRGICQQVINNNPDLSIIPALKCWPHDGGRFITLPMVHTIHPETGNTNVGMYRMQILGKETTAMHWQRHKTGANHYAAWKKVNRKMPVAVALGGDPVYTYCATAPLPENVDEYILAGFLRKKKVKLVRCITNQLYVPYDADIVIEGYIDPAEDPVFEGPFGDHTGFYSLADWYPKLHVTCITHAHNAVYPATIVGIPPQEDAWLIKANEKIFLAPVKITLLPEVIDFHMPDAGVAHNLVIVRIEKSYPGQGMKVINSLLGAGQMMFTKYMIVVSGDTDIRNYKELAAQIFSNASPEKDIVFTRGPLDVLDHSSDTFSFGGKAGIDATVKFPEEIAGRNGSGSVFQMPDGKFTKALEEDGYTFNVNLAEEGIPILVIAINCQNNQDAAVKLVERLVNCGAEKYFALIIAVDHAVDLTDNFIISWQVLSNSDPMRDHKYLSAACLFIDGTTKAFREGGFPRKWPNIVCSDEETVSAVDSKWETLSLGGFIKSPSAVYKKMQKNGTDEVIVTIY